MMPLLALLGLGCKPPTAAGPVEGPIPPPPADLIYFALVDRFADGDPNNNVGVDKSDPQGWHGGDLDGLIDKLDHLQSMGVRTVWVSPIFSSRQQKVDQWGAYHGYWVHDLFKIEPRFGSLHDLQDLADALHARGMRLLLDMVYNHTDYESPLRKAHPEWYHPAKDIVHWDDPVERVERQVHGLPDLAQEREDVYSYLRDASFYWVDAAGVDGYRVDAVRHLPGPFLSRINGELDARYKRFYSLGEDFTGDALTLARSQRSANFDAMFDFPLRYALVDTLCKDAGPQRLAAALSNDRYYTDPNKLVTFLDNHDLPRIASECRGQLDRVRLALAFLMTTRGTPSLTWGTEFMAHGEAEPANRAFTPWGEPAPLQKPIASLQALRRQSEALQRGRTAIFALDNQGLAYARLADEELALIALHTGTEPWSLELPDAFTEGTVLVGHAVASPTGLVVSTQLPPSPIGQRLQIATPSTLHVYLLRSADPTRRLPWAERLATAASPRQLTVQVSGLYLSASSRVTLVGGGPELGNWQPTEAPLMKALGGGRYTATVELPQNTVVDFKPVVTLGSGEVRWADGPNNTLLLQRDTLLDLVWGASPSPAPGR